MHSLEFGSRVAETRIAAGLSRTELGKKLAVKGIDPEFVVKYIESGGVPKNKKVIPKLCKILGIEPVPEVESVYFLPLHPQPF